MSKTVKIVKNKIKTSINFFLNFDSLFEFLNFNLDPDLQSYIWMNKYIMIYLKIFLFSSLDIFLSGQFLGPDLSHSVWNKIWLTDCDETKT